MYKEDLFSESNIFYKTSQAFSKVPAIQEEEYIRLRQNTEGEHRYRNHFGHHPSHLGSSQQNRLGKAKKWMDHSEETYQINNFRGPQDAPDFQTLLGQDTYQTVSNLKIFS